MIIRSGRLCAPCDWTRSARSPPVDAHLTSRVAADLWAEDRARVPRAVVCGSVEDDEEESGFCGCAAGRLGSLSRVTTVLWPAATCFAHNASLLLLVMTSVEPAISSAHRALAIQELVAAIVAHADERSTAALARTSRGLCKPALDSLWEMPKVYDLARRMRPQLYTIKKFKQSEVTLVSCSIC
jgi:hypothetical protein